MNPQQLTTGRTKDDITNEELQKISMKTHLEIQQREDIRRDLAANMKFIPADLVPGEKVYYWLEDPSKIKQGKKGGSWLRVTIVEIAGSMATINTGTGILQVNATKLRRPYEKIDFEAATDSRERADVPVYWQCQIDGPLDFLELFSESTRLSSACATAGLRTGSPVDLRKGCAIYTEKGRQQVWDTIQKQKPLIVFMLPESAPWMWMKSRWKLAAAKERTAPFARWCADIATYQRNHNRYFVLVNPEGSALWMTSPIRWLETKGSSSWTRLKADEFDQT